MTFQVIEPFGVKIAGVETEIKAGTIISLPEVKAIPLIEAGRIKPTDRAAYRIYSEILQGYLWVVETDSDIPFIETSRAKPTETSTHPAPDTALLNLSVSSWLEKLSDSEREIYEERAAIMEYDGGLPREQAEVEDIKRIIRARVVVGKCDRCERVKGCMLTPGQRRLCEVVKP